MIAAALLCLTAPTTTWTRFRDKDTGFVFAMPGAPQVDSTPVRGMTMHRYTLAAGGMFYIVACCNLPVAANAQEVQVIRSNPNDPRIMRGLAVMVDNIRQSVNGTLVSSKPGTFHGWPASVDALSAGNGVKFSFHSVLTGRSIFVAGVSARGMEPSGDAFFSYVQAPKN